MKARMTGSDNGTVPQPTAAPGPRREDPISTMARMSLMTCSFSTAYLLSRARDLSVYSHVEEGRKADNHIPYNIPVKRLLL